MRTIDNLIGELLLRHNCVIVPGFGGFIAQRSSAQIDFTSGLMRPPSKSILFNRQLINNDGLLVAKLGSRNNMLYQDALGEVNNRIQQWKETLKRGERVEIERVGFLFFDAERNLCFEQDRFSNLLLEAFGMGSVRFLEERDVKRAQLQVIRTKVNDENEQTPAIVYDEIDENKIAVGHDVQPRQSSIVGDKEQNLAVVPKTKNLWKYIAAAVLLPVAFYSIWIPTNTDVLQSGVVTLSDFNPFKGNTEKRVVGKSIPKTINLLKSTGVVIEFTGSDSGKMDQAETIPPVAQETEENMSPQIRETQPQFEVIVGSFTDPKNVDEHLAILKNKGLRVARLKEQNGLIRISAGSHVSKQAAHTQKDNLKASGIDAWVLNR